MKRQFLPFVTMVMLTGVISMVSCKKSNDNSSQPVTADTAIVVVNFSTAPSSPYSFFSFKNGVVSSTDSASNKWDFALRLTTFLVNSNASGPGNAGAILQDGIFDNISSAPLTGYAYDTTSGKLAIKDGSWYNYDINTHAFNPIAG